MAEIERVVTRLRSALLKRDAEAQRAVVAAYRVARDGIASDLDALTERMASTIENGEEIGPSWLYRQERYRALLDQTERAMAQYTTDAGNVIAAAQREAVRTAQTDAAQVTLAAMGEAPVGVGVSFTRLPEEALKELIGTLQPGSPLRDVLIKYLPSPQSLEDALISGLARGLNPREIARPFRAQLRSKRRRALLEATTRNAVLDSHRESARRAYLANPQIVKRWRWWAALGPRCCAACVAMHGRTFALEVRMGRHIACRCVMLPVTATWRELGFDVPDDRPAIQTGPDWFDEQPAAAQLVTLGQEKYGFYRDGVIELRDVVHVERSTKWGTSRTVASTDEALANAKARQRKAA